LFTPAAALWGGLTGNGCNQPARLDTYPPGVAMRLLLIASVCAACGGGSTSPQLDAFEPIDIGFNKPTKSLKANNDGTEIGAADLSCLNTPTSDMPTSVSVTLNTLIKDFQSKNPVPGTHVIVFDGIDYANPFDMQVADTKGDATFTIPAGHKRFGFKMTEDTAHTVLPTFLLNQYVDPATAIQPPGSDTDDSKRMDVQSVSNSTAATLPALIGEQRVVGTGVLAGALRDCQHREISNFIATVSSTSQTATPISGASAYYFTASVDLPQHHMQQESASADGLFMVIQIPAAPTAYVQMWGFPTDGDMAADNLKLIDELQVPVLADTVITGSYEPLRM
jgi:hypothetical protein